MYALFVIIVCMLSLFGYTIVANLSYHLYYDGCGSLFGDDDAAKIAATFWVFTLPVCGGIILGSWVIENEFGMACLVAFKQWVEAKRKQSRD